MTINQRVLNDILSVLGKSPNREHYEISFGKYHILINDTFEIFEGRQF